LVDPQVSDEIFKTTTAKNGSFPVRASERSRHTIDGLAPGQAYDVFYMIEGLKGLRSPLPIVDNLDSDAWYQVSAVSERAEGVFSEPVYAVAKTHREPAGLIDTKVSPVQGSTNSISLLTTLDCSSTRINEACGFLSYQVAETPPIGSPEHVKPRQVTQGTVVIADGRSSPHVVRGLLPGKAYSVRMAIESPGSNGVFGPTWEAAATTFPRAPGLVTFEAIRSETKASTVTVRYKLSEPGLLHVNLVEKLGHPLAMMGTIVGNQHGVSFSRELGLSRGDDHDGEEESAIALEGSMVG
ncbi:unnamed protein product, partial [Hapterophycus canaliculatus]